MPTLKEYKELEQKITPAPWEVEYSDHDNNGAIYFINNDLHLTSYEEHENNAKFIAESRNITPELIRVIELAEEYFNAIQSQSKLLNKDDAKFDLYYIYAERALSGIRKLKGEQMPIKTVSDLIEELKKLDGRQEVYGYWEGQEDVQIKGIFTKNEKAYLDVDNGY